MIPSYIQDDYTNNEKVTDFDLALTTYYIMREYIEKSDLSLKQFRRINRKISSLEKNLKKIDSELKKAN